MSRKPLASVVRRAPSLAHQLVFASLRDAMIAQEMVDSFPALRRALEDCIHTLGPAALAWRRLLDNYDSRLRDIDDDLTYSRPEAKVGK